MDTSQQVSSDPGTSEASSNTHIFRGMSSHPLMKYLGRGHFGQRKCDKAAINMWCERNIFYEMLLTSFDGY